jgi:hypothetical protein
MGVVFLRMLIDKDFPKEIYFITSNLFKNQQEDIYYV